MVKVWQKCKDIHVCLSVPLSVSPWVISLTTLTCALSHLDSALVCLLFGFCHVTSDVLTPHAVSSLSVLVSFLFTSPTLISFLFSCATLIRHHK